MNTRTFTLLLLAGLSAALTSCLKDNVEVQQFHYTDQEYETLAKTLDLPQNRDSYQAKLPLHMTRMGFTAPSVSDAKATLGRVLFYDVKLSRNNTVSCASCHKQDLAFSDDVALSKGFNGELTKRNSLALGATASFESSYGGGGGNVFGFKAGFFWDERAQSIHDQSRQTIQDDIEMGMNLADLTVKLRNEEYYQILFRKAYSDDFINEDRILESLQEFVNTFFSVGSKFDEGLNSNHFQDPNINFGNFTFEENLGKSLFVQHCGGCHSANMTTLTEIAANNGLDLEYSDNGVGDRTGMAFDAGRFKVPFLRNIALTGPYMHDGRFATLEEVIEHYNSGVKAHPNLDQRLRDPFNPDQPRRLNLTDQEKSALVAFLKTLTDPEFIQDGRYSDPFIH